MYWKKNSNKFLLIILTTAIAGFYIFSKYEDFQLKARSKEGLTLLKSAYVAMEATHAEQNAYPLDLKQSGFHPSAKLHYSIHLTEDKLESGIKALLPTSYLPFAQKDNFRLVVTSELSTGLFHFCKAEAKTKIECIWLETEK